MRARESPPGPRTWPGRERLALLLLVAVFLAQGVLFVTLTPPWQAPDEPANLGAVAYTSHLRALGPSHRGVPDAIFASTVRYRLDELRAWPDYPNTSPAPAADSFQVGQRSYSVSVYNLVAVPVYLLGTRGGVLGALYALRVLGVLFGALAVVFTFLLARELRMRPALALLAAAVVAAVPQFGSITASVTKDSMAAAVGSLSLWLIARAARRGVTLPRAGAAAGAVALGAATKPTLLVLLVPLAVTLAMASAAEGRFRVPTILRVGGLLAALAAAALIAGPWLPLNYLDRARHSHVGAALRTLRQPGFVSTVLTSSWGDFGWENAPLNSLSFAAAFGVTACAAAGLCRLLVRQGRTWIRRDAATAAIVAGLLATVAAFIVVQLVAQANGFSSQGRFWFPAISAFGVLVALGLGHLVPFLRDRRGVAAALVVGCGWNLLVLLRQFPDRFGIL